MKRAALGFRHHSGWAAMVAIAGDVSSPILLLRRRVDLLNSDLPSQPYHVASRLSSADAQRLIEEVKNEALDLGRKELEVVGKELSELGYVVAAVGLAAETRRLPSLEKVLGAHALSHMAEGEIFHQALVEAATRLDLTTIHVSPKDYEAEAAARLAKSPEELVNTLRDLGKAAGAPWQSDQRLAGAAALCALEPQA